MQSRLRECAADSPPALLSNSGSMQTALHKISFPPDLKGMTSKDKLLQWRLVWNTFLSRGGQILLSDRQIADLNSCTEPEPLPLHSHYCSWEQTLSLGDCLLFEDH